MTNILSCQRKPTWRGWLHTVMTPLAILFGTLLIVNADGARARSSAVVFSVASCMLFGTSALFHRVRWGVHAHTMLRRLDHANIYLLIAGTYTPMALLCLPASKASILLAIVWTGAILGITFRICWITAPRWLYVGLYLVLGWAAVIFSADLFRASWLPMTLILAGGLAYTLGAVVYGTKRPDPAPARFGFHEIFHAMTIVAFVLHWNAIYLVATSPPVLA